MLRRGGSKRLSSSVLAIEHVWEMDDGLDWI